MFRQPELESILEAWYETETCATAEKFASQDALNRLLDEARTGSHLSRQDLIQALADGA